MKKKLTSLFLAFLMTFSFAANVSAQVAVDEAGVAGITINPIQSQSVGKPVSISGSAAILKQVIRQNKNPKIGTIGKSGAANFKS